MGYHMSLTDQNFFIDKKHIQTIVDKVKENAEKFQGAYSQAVDDAKRVENLDDALGMGHFAPDIDEGGNINYLDFVGEKKGWGEEELFEIIAPYVQKDSFLQFSGEDGALWRYVFDGKTVREIEPEIIW